MSDVDIQCEATHTKDMAKTKQRSVRLALDTEQKIGILAERARRDWADYVRLLLEDHVREEFGEAPAETVQITKPHSE